MSCLQPDQIRNLVMDTFKRLGLDPNRLLAETVLIRDGYYYGRSYRAGELIATFVAETSQLKFFASDGRMLTTLCCDEVLAAPQHRQAA
jgi:hypothetical protein